MAEAIQELFITPPLVIARLGGGSVPQDAYRWAESPNPRSSGETVEEKTRKGILSTLMFVTC